MNVDPDVNYDELARSTDDFNGAQCKAVCVEAGQSTVLRALRFRLIWCMYTYVLYYIDLFINYVFDKFSSIFLSMYFSYKFK